MKLLFLLLILIGCSDHSDLQSNINEFTSDCETLAKCLDKSHEVKIDLTSRNKLTCVIKFSEVTNGHLRISEHLDLDTRPTFGYEFLEPAIETCKMAKQQGDYSKEEQNVMFRYKKCIDLDPNSEDQRHACWTQYRNGEFYEK